MRGNASDVRITGVQDGLIQPTVLFAINHFIGILPVTMTALDATPDATDTKVALLDVVIQCIIKLTMNRNKDMNVFDAPANVEHV